MDLLTTNVSVFEPNETRADLYALWLDDYNVRTALTRREADDLLDGSAGVVVVNRAFGGGEGETLVGIARRRNPVCTVVAVRGRSQGFPGVDPANHLVRPVFEEDLRGVVDRLMRRVNYRLGLVEYYRASARVASFEFGADSAEAAATAAYELDFEHAVCAVGLERTADGFVTAIENGE